MENVYPMRHFNKTKNQKEKYKKGDNLRDYA